MSLLSFSIVGSIASLLMMVAGFVWLGARREFDVSRVPREQGSAPIEADTRGRTGSAWFRGIPTGISYSAEKPTSEIIALLAAGRLREGLPWATPAIGALAAFFFWPLLIGIVLGLRGVVLWVLVAAFFFGGLYAAWPRGAR